MTHEGVFDLSGNLSEWVLDRYSDSAYAMGPDTLSQGQTLDGCDSTLPTQFRGGNYRKLPLSNAALQNLARCSNRDTPRQVRPSWVEGCISSTPLIAIQYTGTVSPTRCLEVPEEYRGKITGMTPGRDSTVLVLFLSESKDPVQFTLPTATGFEKGRPLSARLVKKSLLRVTFIHSETGEKIEDFLDGQEAPEGDSTGLVRLLQREAKAPWNPVMSNGFPEVEYLYSDFQLRNAQAKSYYANRSLGFRCCSNPIPIPAPILDPIASPESTEP
jgi:hypothetical protein